MLQNAYFLAKIGADTAENEQHFAEILPTDAAGRLRHRELCEFWQGHLGHPFRAGLPEPGGSVLGSNFGAFFENAFFENFANFWRARSRLYQNEILQENMRSTAFFKLYKICILLHRCNLKFFAKNSV